jgi:signal transduction histidine kinase
VQAGEPLHISGDPDQLDQLLINVIRNAADASLENNGSVHLTWTRTSQQVRIFVRDEGPGLSNTANLFVPFFTTKPGGSGIGLVLSRQIAEAHGGALMLQNRENAPGCEAVLSLPL